MLHPTGAHLDRVCLVRWRTPRGGAGVSSLVPLVKTALVCLFAARRSVGLVSAPACCARGIGASNKGARPRRGVWCAVCPVHCSALQAAGRCSPVPCPGRRQHVVLARLLPADRTEYGCIVEKESAHTHARKRTA